MVEAVLEEVSVDTGIEELRKQLDAAKAEKVNLERRAQEAENTASAALGEKRENEILLIDGAIAEMERNDTILTQALADANATGDFVKAAEIQREMISTAQKVDRLKDGKEKLAATPVPKPVVRDADPVEELARQLTPLSAAWIRAHPECATDKNMNRRLVAAHNLAETTPGVLADSPEYFSIIEKTLYPAQQQKEDELVDDPISDAGKEAPARNAPAQAPVSRGGSSRGTVTLSKAQREMAEELGMTDKEYAENLSKLREEGRMQ